MPIDLSMEVKVSREKPRDYKAEYRRRVARALAKGLSRSQARGHRKPAELKPTRKRAERALEDAKLQMGLRFLRKGHSFAAAAKEAHLSPERLRTYAVEKGLVHKRGRRWVIRRTLPRRVLIYSGGAELEITVPTFRAASLVGKYMAGVRWFVQTNDIAHLRPFAGLSVKDSDGKRHPLETRPNVLHRLTSSGGSTFEQVYRIVV